MTSKNLENKCVERFGDEAGERARDAELSDCLGSFFTAEFLLYLVDG